MRVWRLSGILRWRWRRAAAGKGVVMMLRIQRERLVGLEVELAEYVEGYQLTEERLATLAPEAVVMHPGPMIRGLEIRGRGGGRSELGD